jgi:hypothetical protein
MALLRGLFAMAVQNPLKLFVLSGSKHSARMGKELGAYLV